MRKQILGGIAAAALFLTVSAGTDEIRRAQAANPIVQTIYSTDPAPMVWNDTVYVYTGRDKDQADFYHMPDWHCYSSTDMQNWTDHGTVLSWDSFSYGKEDSAWASQCIERNGKFYLYVTLESNTGGGRAIGVAVADSPTGPFRDAIGKPLCGPNWAYIDPTVFIDDDGQAWLMFGNPTCYYVRLNEDMISLSGEIKAFDMTEAAFGATSREEAPTGYGEGPWFYRRGDLYYLVYAAFGPGNGSEDIRYSTAPSPTGPWTYRGVIMERYNCYTNHPGVVDFRGKSYFFYHDASLPGGGTFDRSVCVEEFAYNADGSFPLIKPTKAGPEQIETLNPYRRVEAETINWSSGIKTEPIDAGTMAIGYIENGDYVRVSGVDFGDGAASFHASVASNGSGGKIELHLDSADGRQIGACDVPVTGGWQNWTMTDCEVSGASGTHDLYLVFTGGSSYLFNVDWWQFRKSKDVLLGDVDGNGKINAADFTLAKRGALNGFTDYFAQQAADVDCSGKVDADDIKWYVLFLTGQTAVLPEKQIPQKSDFPYQSALQLSWADEEYFKPCAQSGTVINETYTGINGSNKLNVYLPYGYDPNKQYNIFYLMHGGSENENTVFSNDVKIHYMLDHMIMDGKLDPLIVVAPTFNRCSAETFYKEFRASVVPFVEGKYSTYAKSTSEADLKASRMHRAYGGFSMGAGSTWRVAVNCMDLVGYFMPLSGHNWDGVSGLTSAIDRFGFTPRDYFIFAATGSNDIAYGNMKPQIEAMKSDSHFVYTSDFSVGNFYFLLADGKDHWWGYVRHYMYNALPYFFHEGQ